MQEIPEEIICRAKVCVDSCDEVMAESGDLIIPIERVLISPGHDYAGLGEILAGKKTGRTDNGEITLFKSVGFAVKDVAAAYAGYRNARSRGIGHLIDWLE
jgi:ornithine cyclodeaminase/alanine dehydrogenase-like protein (mu-crystallin family)